MKRSPVLAAVLMLSWGGTGLAAATTEPSTSSTPASACRVHELPLPPGVVEAVVFSVSPNGHWRAGEGEDSEGEHVALVWHADEVQRLIVPSASSHPSINDIANNGDLVGQGTVSEYGLDPFARIDNKIVRLSAPGFGLVRATGIDERGHLVGIGGDDAMNRKPLRWDVTAPDAPEVIDLPYTPGTGLFVETNARGTIVVSPNTLPNTEKSWLIRPNGHQSVLRGIKGAGGTAELTISGHWVKGASIGVPIRWDLSNGAKPDRMDDILEYASAVDPDGRLSGQLPHNSLDAVITDGVTTTILDPIDPLEPYGHSGVTAMSARGSAVGYSDRNDRPVPVEWTCNFS